MEDFVVGEIAVWTSCAANEYYVQIMDIRYDQNEKSYICSIIDNTTVWFSYYKNLRKLSVTELEDIVMAKLENRVYPNITQGNIQ